MTLYLVMDGFREGSDTPTLVYGCFTSKERADEIANDIRKSLKEDNDDTEIVITELVSDRPTDDYYWFMEN